MGLLVSPMCQVYMWGLAPHITLRAFGIKKSFPRIENVVKGLCHYIFLAPTIFPTFLFMTYFLKNWSVQDGLDNVKEKLSATLYVSLHYWPMINVAGYVFVPFIARQSFFDCASFLW